jgi:2-methylfumaryl-CoA isomerase
VPAPWLGQHTEEVLMSVLALGGAAIGRLMDARVVAGPRHDPFHSWRAGVKPWP